MMAVAVVVTVALHLPYLQAPAEQHRQQQDY